MTALRAVPDPATAEGFRPPRLVDRELRVLTLLAEGSESPEIAVELGYAERTIKNIVHDLLTKLNARTRAHAIAEAVRWGWLTVDNNAMMAARTRIEALELQVRTLERRIDHAALILRDGER